MDTTLSGVEAGLSGYWPLDETYEIDGFPVVADLTANHNDLWVQGNAQILPLPTGSEINLAPSAYFYDLRMQANGDFIHLGSNAGWPRPSLSLLDGPTGMIINPENNVLSWTPGAEQRGYHEFSYQAASAAGSITSSSRVWVDSVWPNTAFHNVGNARLNIANNGTISGFSYNEVAGLWGGNLMLGISDGQVSGGLFVDEFSQVTGIIPVESEIGGFDQAFESSFDDLRAPNPIGIDVLQRSHSSSNSLDEDYVIIEYEITNTSPAPIWGLYVGLAADWDVGAAPNNLAGYDADQSLSYTYEVNGGANPYYYGATILSHPVSGHSASSGGAGDDSQSYIELTTFAELPVEATDVRSTLGCGPFDLAVDETIVVKYAMLGGDDLADLISNAKRVHTVVGGLENVGSAYLHQTSRIRVTDATPIHPSANPAAYAITGNEMSVEAWVFPTRLPEEGEAYPIVVRPYLNEQPLRAYELQIGNQDGDNVPKYNFVLTDGNVGGDNVWISSNVPAVAGVWMHLAATYDGSLVRLYMDGLEVGEAPFTANIGAGNTGFYLGLYAQPFQGLLDEVRLWNIPRSQADIITSMNITLAGVEAGLVGYWPLNDTYEVDGLPVVSDLTANHNDLWVQGNAQSVAFPTGSEVLLAPGHFWYDLTAVVGELFEVELGLNDGWPLPSITLSTGPEGMSIDPSTNVLSWTPGIEDRGYHEFHYSATNAHSLAGGSSQIWVDAVLRETATLDVGNAGLTYANSGMMGFYDHPANNAGFTFEGVNGLYAGNLMLGLSDDQVSGGLYVEEFGQLSGINPVVSELAGFDQAYESTFDDLRSLNPIGLHVVQRTHASSNSQDEDFMIVDYEIINASGSNITGLYVGLSTDWDVGDAAYNLGGYDEEQRLSYTYEVDGIHNAYYYGVAALSHPVSGHSGSVGSSDDAESYATLTSFTELPVEAGDLRSTLGCGPFDLAVNETVVVRYAMLGGNDLADLAINVERAHSFDAVSANELIAKPESYALNPNYPNPFNPTTTISYALPEQSQVKMTVFDIRGQEILTLQDDVKPPGNYEVHWNGVDDSGNPASTGVYFCRLDADGFNQTIKMVLLR